MGTVTDKDTETNLEETKLLTQSEEKFDTSYTLHYKAVHNVGQLFFKGPADKQKAIELGKNYCQDRKWRFIQVRPMFNDITETPQSEEERAKYTNART